MVDCSSSSSKGDNSHNRSRNRCNFVQTARRLWIPRGAAVASTATTTQMSPALPFNDVSDNGRNGNSSAMLVLQENESRIYQGFRDNKYPHPNQGRDRENENIDAPNDTNVPLLVQEIQDKLMKNAVECMICYEMVRRSAPIWSCSGCFSIFHLSCIKKWARAPNSVDLSAEKSRGFNWRCPGCQAVQLMSSKEIRYLCFCRKRLDPPSDFYVTPHSCGETCGKPLEKEVPGAGMTKDDLCPHFCVLQCHPGPCPPCRSFAPPQRCPCGKKVITTRCSDRKPVLTCGQLCDKPLVCGRHRCERICHIGPCDPCRVLFNASCFCQKKIETVLCRDMVMKGQCKVEDGLFSCNSTCGKKLDCGNHVCAESCHPGPCGECHMLPSNIKTCCCGKTSLKIHRESCMDPVPTCSKTCEKILPCGVHQCKEMCHSGVCAPCPMLVPQKCRCELASRTIECHKTQSGNEKFTCDKPCGHKKTCGRHRCSERCCPMSSYITAGDGDGAGAWDPHLCMIPCGKKLRCGQHSCPLLCHSGHCPPCLEMIFTDLTCACGKTSMAPPLPCGTPYPSCQHPCSVPQPCGHPSTHSCHFVACPPCTVPIAKDCIGGHVVLRNIPCGSKDIRCNKLCGKTRECGMHPCARNCHPPPCDPSSGSSTTLGASCGQICGAPRRDCRHTCTAQCHPSAACPDLRCEFPVTISCSCGHITANVPCDAGSSNGAYTTDTVLEASVLQKLPAPLQPVEGNVRVPLGQRKLMCDDECPKIEKKKLLADAIGATTLNLEALHFGETAIVSDILRRDPKWLLAVEERCKYLVSGRTRGGINTLRVHVFCTMPKDKRDAIRLIAERWKLSVNAAGWEPKRFVVVHVTPKSKPPVRNLGSKGPVAAGNTIQPSVFDPSVDMDPRVVISLFDLPRDADVSALVLRFGGECELVWLNDKNGLVVFNDPARAATAMRRLDQSSVYHGASAVVVADNVAASASGHQNGWGTTGEEVNSLKFNPWKKAVMKNPDFREWSGNSGDSLSPARKVMEASIAAASTNRWSILESDTNSRSFKATNISQRGEFSSSGSNK